jgi:hypothetical protein
MKLKTVLVLCVCGLLLLVAVYFAKHKKFTQTFAHDVAHTAAVMTGLKDEKKGQNTSLINGLQGGQKQQDVLAQLKSQGLKWKVVEDKKGAASNPGEETEIEVGNYRHLNIKGSLNLDFFNRQLCQLWFTPSDVTAYRSALSRQLGTVLEENRPLLIKGVEIELRQGDKKQYYVVWSDEQRSDRLTEWKKFNR